VRGSGSAGRRVGVQRSAFSVQRRSVSAFSVRRSAFGGIRRTIVLVIVLVIDS
jgi:hypothetical protein